MKILFCAKEFKLKKQIKFFASKDKKMTAGIIFTKKRSFLMKKNTIFYRHFAVIKKLCCL